MKCPLVVAIAACSFVWMNGSALSQSLSWTKLNGPRNGWVSAIEVDGEGFTFAATATHGYHANSGGIFRSADGGKTWAQLGNGLPDPGVLVTEYHLLNARDTAIFAGAFAGYSYESGAGVYRSFNHGDSWENVTPPVPTHMDGTSYRDVFGLIADTDGIIYCVLYDGIFRSTNMGSSWTWVYNRPNRYYGILISLDSSHCPVALTDGLFLRSTDHGVTWDSTSFPYMRNGRDNSLTVASDGSIYACGTEALWSPYGLFRSTNYGKTWESVNDSVYANPIASDLQGVLWAGSYEDLLRSTDQGKTWNAVSRNWYNRKVTSIYIDRKHNRRFAGTESCDLYLSLDVEDAWNHQSSVGSTYALIHRLVISKDSRFIFTGTKQSDQISGTSSYIYYDVTPFRSTDCGMSWRMAEPGGNSMAGAVYDSKGRILAGGVRSTDNGESWTYPGIGAGEGHPKEHTITINSHDQLFAADWLHGGTCSSTDDGYSWSPVGTGFEGNQASCLVVGPHDVLFAGTWAHVFRSTDNGQNWTRHYEGLTFPTISGLAVDSSGIVYAGTWGAGIFRSTNNGDTWTKVSSGRLDTLKVWTFAVAPTGDIFAGTYDDTGGKYNGVYLSRDHGLSWSAVNDGLEDLKILTLAADGIGNIYAGTQSSGVFKTTVLPQVPLATPALLSPLNLASFQPLAPVLKWTYVNGAVNYHLQVSTDSSFLTRVVYSDSIFNDTLKALSGLQAWTTYFWRVRAIGPRETTPWSEVWSFSTGLPERETHVFTGPVDTAWVRHYGRDAMRATAMDVDPAGNVYMTGSAFFGGKPALPATVKFSSSGDIAWARPYERSGDKQLQGVSIRVAPGGAVYVTGRGSPATWADTGITVQYDNSGNVQWARDFTVAWNPSALVLDANGTPVVTGATYTYSGGSHSILTIRYNSTGGIVWAREYLGRGEGYIGGVAAVDSGGNVYVAAMENIYIPNYSALLLIKHSTGGDSLWTRRFSPGSNNSPGSIAADNKGNVYVAARTGYAYTERYGSYIGGHIATIKYNSEGDTLWVRHYLDGDVGIPSDLAVDGDGNIIVTGYSGVSLGENESGYPAYDFSLVTIKYDPAGETLWVRRRAGFWQNRGLAVDHSGNVYVSGSGSGVVTLKYNKLGNEEWTALYLSGAGSVGVGVDNQGNVYTACTNWWHAQPDYVNSYTVIKYQQSSTGISATGLVPPTAFVLEQNYPNPFNPFTIIKYTVAGAGSGLSGRDSRSGGPESQDAGARKTRLVVYDVLGRQVATLVNEPKLPGHYEVTFDGSQLSSGVYFYRMEAGAFVQTRKLVLLK